MGSIFLTRSLLNHPSLISLRTDDPLKDLHQHTRNLVNSSGKRVRAARQLSSRVRRVYTPSSLFFCFRLREKKKKKTAAYRTPRSNNGFPLPVRLLNAIRNLLKTAAISRSFLLVSTGPSDLCYHMLDRTRDPTPRTLRRCGASDETLRETANLRARFIYIRNRHA